MTPTNLGIKPGTCLRCGDPGHDMWSCPTYGKDENGDYNSFPTGPCLRCFKGSHWMKDCVGEKVDTPAWYQALKK